MDSTTKAKTVNLEDLQASQQQALNKGVGNSCVCSTAAATAAKEVTLGTTFSLVSGAMILVTFTNGITSANSTLAVTHTTLAGTTTTETAKPIYLNGSALEADIIDAGASLILRYNGTQFDIVGGAGSGDKNAVLVGDYQGTATYPEFDPMLDTVHTKAQTLTEAQKLQARTNIGVVGSGFQVSTDETTGTDTFTALGTATITHNDTTGADEFAF